MIASLSLVLKKILLVFLLVAGLYYAKAFLMPLCIGGILATLFLPFCTWLEQKKMPRVIAVLLCLLLLLAVIAGLALLLGYKIAEVLNDIVLLKQKAIVVGTSIQNYIFNHLNITIEQQFTIIQNEQPSYSKMMQNLLYSISYIATNLVLVIVYFVMLLYYRSHIKLFLVKITATSQQKNMQEVVLKSARISQHYLLGLSKMIFLLWIMYSIGFGILGVKNALFFAILCGLLEIVPFVGNITGTLLTVLIAIINGASPTLVVGIVGVYIVVQLIQGWILEPLILGPQVKINSLFTIIALVVGQLLWGIPGIILAIPITAILKIVCDHVEYLQPYGYLLGAIKPTKKPIALFKKQP